MLERSVCDLFSGSRAVDACLPRGFLLGSFPTLIIATSKCYIEVLLHLRQMMFVDDFLVQMGEEAKRLRPDHLPDAQGPAVSCTGIQCILKLIERGTMPFVCV